MTAMQVTIGRDASVTFQSTYGTFSFAQGTTLSLSRAPIVQGQRRSYIDGQPKSLTFHNGHQVGVTFDRSSANADELWARVESDYYAGIAQSEWTATVRTRNSNGSITTERYYGGTWEQFGPGDAAGEASIQQSCQFFFARREVQ